MKTSSPTDQMPSRRKVYVRPRLRVGPRLQDRAANLCQVSNCAQP